MALMKPGWRRGTTLQAEAAGLGAEAGITRGGANIDLVGATRFDKLLLCLVPDAERMVAGRAIDGDRHVLAFPAL